MSARLSFTISVVIPAYNAARDIERAVRSVLAQSRPAEEIIVVDDGSSDDTADVVSRFGPIVTYLRQNNRGPGAARNAGVRIARGELVAFLDADDEFLPEMLANLAALFAQDRSARAACGAHLYDGPGGIVRTPAEESVLGPGVHAGPIRDFFDAYRRSRLVCVGSVMVQRSAFLDVGGFREDIRFGEDIGLWTRLAGRFGWLYLDEPVCVYHHAFGTSATLRTPEASKGVGWALTEQEMRAQLPAAQWQSYRRFRRDCLVREARNALHQFAGSTARAILRGVAPAPLSVAWVATWVLARMPARVSRLLLVWRLRIAKTRHQ